MGIKLPPLPHVAVRFFGLFRRIVVMKFYNDFNSMFNAQSGVKKDMSVFNSGVCDIVLSILDQLQECENDVAFIRKRIKMSYDKMMSQIDEKDRDSVYSSYEDIAEQIPLIDMQSDCHKYYNALVEKINGIYNDILEMSDKY